MNNTEGVYEKTEENAIVSVDVMGDPVEILVSRDHAVLEYAVLVTVWDSNNRPVASRTENVQLEWKRGWKKPAFLKARSLSAERLCDFTEVLEDMKEAVNYARDLQREQN